MLLLLAEVLRLCAVAEALPGSGVWAFLCRQQSHAEWVGCNLHDLIQPSFTFLVGVSLAFSVAHRRARGDATAAIVRHAIMRAVVLVVLGVVLISSHPRTVLWRPEDTLTQIGLGYAFAFALAWRSPRVQWGALAVILAITWLVYALYPIVPSSYDFKAAGVDSEWLRQHGLAGFEAHWQKNANVGWALDVAMLSWLPGNMPWNSPRGLVTLNALPTLATMILGLTAGQMLRTSTDDRIKVRWLSGAGALSMLSGLLLDWSGICPIVKPLWTPSWVLFSGGWCLFAMALFYELVERRGLRRLFLPLVVVGMNSIVAYAMSHLYPAFAYGALRRVFGEAPFLVLRPAFQPFVYGLAVLACYWLFLYVLYKRGWFLRI